MQESFLRKCDRVLVDQFTATTRKRALDDHDISPTVFFVRDDGWTLGAPKHLETQAYKLYSADWTHYTRWPDDRLKPIREYDENPMEMQ
jgi:hypothetical protein